MIDTVWESYADRESWLDARGIGASDIAAILGVGGRAEDEPHRTAWDVWARCTKRERAQRETEDMRRGRKWEPIVLAVYRGETGNKIVTRPHLLARHPVLRWATASPDALVVDPWDPDGFAGAVEAKTDRSPANTAWGDSREVERWTDDAAKVVRADYALQAYWQALVTGLPWVDIAVLLPWYEMRVYRLHRDPEVLAELEAQIGEWHRRHVIGGEPPPLDGSDACLDHLRWTFPGGGGPRLATAEEAEKIRRYAALRAAVKRAEAECDQLRAELLAAAGNADSIPLEEPGKRNGTLDLSGVPRLTVIRSKRDGGIDLPRLLADHPGIDVARYRRGPTYSVSIRPYNLEKSP